VAEYTPYPVELITPEGAAFADEAQQVIVPGSAGQLGILANHAPLVSLLDAGEVRITDASGALQRFATAAGFLQVRENRALLLVGEAVHKDRIDSAEARTRLEAAQAAVEAAGEDDADQARRELAFAEALVATAE
jgi:F-type H+-transporting ATPase subunit epsilon